jgi:hypothetical protein
MKKNVIVLTHGWTGSSLFAALLARAGYWLGDETMQKTDYDTFENLALVNLNKHLIDTLACDIDHEHRFAFDDVLAIERAAATHDPAPLRDFVSRCSSHGPWLWKDPRLTWTIRVWGNVLDLERTAFLVLTRDDVQAWISTNRRRHIQSMQFTRHYNHGITRANVRFLDDRRLPYLATSLEDLVLAPEPTLARLNAFFELNLSMDDLKAVCKLPLGRKSQDWRAWVVASLIYVKNHGQRDGGTRSRSQSLRQR